MANRNDNDDFFSQEFEKKQQENRVQQTIDNDAPQTYLNWSKSNAATKPDIDGKRRVTAILLVIAFVFTFVFGVLISHILFSSLDKEARILNEVLKTVREMYYSDLTDEQWNDVVASGGTAIFQSVDTYGQLLTPQQAYDLLYATTESTDNPDGYFGFTFQYVSGLGLYVYGIASDGSSYGVLERGDIIVGVEQMTAISGIITDQEGNAVTQLDFNTMTAEQASHIMGQAKSAKFSYLRGNVTDSAVIERGKIGSKNNESNKMHFVEYYFSDVLTNVSTTNENKAKANTKQLRNLDALDSNVGYIHLTQFDIAYDADTGSEIAADEEFKQALYIFKASGCTKLVVDLKGNPGGYIDVAANIAGMLTTTELLSPLQISSNGLEKNGQMLIGRLEYTLGGSTGYYANSLYDSFFTYKGTGTKDIVIWTDDGSASASELLTGAILDYGTGIHMGTTTYGKGIAQNIVPLQNFSEQVTTHDGGTDVFYWCMYYTVAKFNSPMGANIHGTGYTPAVYNNLFTYPSLTNATNSYFGG